MNKSKGFTIIELIVVIAIIAVLAAIVLVNVTQYINKAKDSAIKANLDTIRVNAAAYMADTTLGNGHFNGFLATVGYTNPQSAVNSGGGAVTATCNGTSSTCATTSTDGTKFCVSSTLATSATTHYCIDSDGKTGTAQCAAGVCP
jgi:prepilin-type N-terminal cleavage/methylation domain-containing protein